MKSFSRTILLLLAFGLSAIAQTTITDISMNPSGESAGDWNMTIVIDLSESLPEGLAIELPVKSKIVPVAVQLNGGNLWMKESQEAPAIENTLTWFEEDSGRVILRFRENQLTAGDRLVVECATHMEAPAEADDQLALKRLNRSGDSVTSAEQPFVSRTLPTIEETN